jgi:hypothetical protein
MTNIIRELEEELKQEDWIQFWRTYGMWIGAAVFVALLGFGCYLGWQSYKMAERARASEDYEHALVLQREGKLSEARSAFQKLVSHFPNKGYGILARLRLQGLAQRIALDRYDPEDVKKLETFYRAFQAWARENYYRGVEAISNLGIGYNFLNFKRPFPDLKDMIDSYDTPQNPWGGLFLELGMLDALRLNRLDDARKLYEKLSKRVQHMPGLRQRVAFEKLALDSYV